MNHATAQVKKIHILRLKREDKLIQKITEYCTQKKVYCANITNIIGGCSKATIRCMNSNNKFEYNEHELTQPMELTAQGNLAQKEGNPSTHIHAILSKPDGTAITGHLVEAEISVVAEIFIEELDTKMTRKKLPEVFDYPALTMEE
jgi:uncharacterized protein